MANESKRVDLTIGQVRILHHVLEHYIRNHDVILHNSEFDVNEMRLLFADMARYCELCKDLSDILSNHINQTYKEGR